MGLLFSRIAKILWRNDEFKVVIVGLDNAGKTTILYKLYANTISGQFNDDTA